MPYRPAFARPLFDKNRALPRMSWAPENLYNIWQRVSPDGPLRGETNFTRTSMTLFQQRWRSKRLSRGYHGDHIGETKFERWYLPEALPSIHAEGKRGASGAAKVKPSRETGGLVAGRTRDSARVVEERNRQEKERSGRVPIGTMLYREVERRLDVLVFRACLASSVWQARQMVVHRKVTLNGRIENNPNIRLNPGDMFSVDPSAMPMLAKPQAKTAAAAAAADVSPSEESAAEPSSDETETPAVDPETGSAPSPSPSDAADSAATTPSTPAPAPAAKVDTAKAWFTLPAYAAPHLFVPAYLEPNFKTCSAVYVRHPTARPGYSEIPSPYDADGEVMSLSWEWFKWRAPNMSKRRHRWMSPERQTDQK
ncbi:hypothetical protein NliqN6_3639 [Naganishia liquefaciens]|uniref:RNA-binding S4 domain-containing protein n=1 Tax=Naganishia liquefaciens TaxID=104408 RepID=A0A8H3YGH6_9TREE|nr:hypothetical protein NliqN6_3639 [Naganishia liquefaciens]